METPDPMNFPLLWKVYDHIVAHPEEHYQEAWALKGTCGTQFCFAGHAVAIGRPDAEVAWKQVGDYAAASVVIEGDMAYEIRDIAKETLGLTDMEADALFYSGNTVEHIHRILTCWEKGEPAPWA